MLRPLALALAALALPLGLAGCGATASTAPAAAGPVAVVASTDVYGDLVAAVGGDAVSVTSIIDRPDQDPHEYAADARTQLALSKARLVVRNGAGYDDFVATMLSSLPTPPEVLDVADLSGRDQHPASGTFNEHLWYDLPTVQKLVDRLGTELAAAAPEHAATITANAADLTRRLKSLRQREDALAKAHRGTGVAVTEPVPLYLLQACGLVNRTPSAFTEAVEEGTDVPPAVLAATERLLTGHAVALLVPNAQTAGPQTERVLATARTAGVPVVPVTETLPEGETYLSWMGHNLDAVGAALEA